MNSDPVTIERNRARLLLLYAVRYALGRESGAPLDATEAVRLHADAMHAEDLRGMARDVAHELAADPGVWRPLAHAAVWADFERWCRAEVARREADDRAAARGSER